MEPFKKCNRCGKIWESRDKFLELDDLLPLGYQTHYSDGFKSVILFLHDVPECRTTLAIPITNILDLIPGFDLMENKMLSEKCRGLCLRDPSLEPCDNNNCRNTLVRNFIRDLYKKKKSILVT
jgi:hypothetical protein